MISSALANMTVGSTEFVFTGSTNLVKGVAYTFIHDDGLTLAIDGVSVINKPGVTVAVPDSFGYTGTTGVHAFTLTYSSNAFSAAVLTGPFTPAAAATPEPSSFIMLGTGLLGAAGMIRRRFLA